MTDPKPTGSCFCGCGGAATPGRFLVQTHDRTAETAVIREKYGSIAAFVVAHGYGPEAPVSVTASRL